MARLIDADELVSKINKLDIFYFIGETDIAVHDCQMVELGAVLSEIDEAPTVDAAPVAHGRWIPTYHTYYNRAGEYQIADEWHCSECNIYSRGQWNYCPNCGAHMDLEVKDA